MEAIMFFEQAIAHQIPGYTKEADSLHGESLAMLDYKDELKVKKKHLGWGAMCLVETGTIIFCKCYRWALWKFSMTVIIIFA